MRYSQVDDMEELGEGPDGALGTSCWGGLAELTGTKLPGLTQPERQDRGAWRAKTVRLRWNHGPFGGSKALSRTGGGSTLLPEVPRQVWLALGALGRGG